MRTLAAGVAMGVALLFLAGPRTAAAQEHDTIGIVRGAVPDGVVIEDLDGNPVDLGAYIGDGPLLIEFWATWCENCEALHPHMEAAHARYRDRVDFLAVAVAVGQSKRTIRRHLRQRPVSFPVLWDTEGRAARAFMAPVTSYIVILDRDGRVTYTGAGRAQDIEQAIQTAVGDEDTDATPS